MSFGASRNQVISDHRYLCVRAARKFVRRGVDRRDLEQVAAIGLIKAADRFDPGQGTPFEAFAWVLVLGELMHFVRDGERLLRTPRRLRQLEKRWAESERELLVLFGRQPARSEIANYLGLAAEDVLALERYWAQSDTISVDALRPYDQRSLAYTIDRQIDHLVIKDALSELSPIERRILLEIYERDTPLVDIAQALGYSTRHVTRLHRAALKKLEQQTRPVAG